MFFFKPPTVKCHVAMRMKRALTVLWVLACVRASGTTTALEKPRLTHTAARCSVDEAGEPELQVRALAAERRLRCIEHSSGFAESPLIVSPADVHASLVAPA